MSAAYLWYPFLPIELFHVKHLRVLRIVAELTKLPNSRKTRGHSDRQSFTRIDFPDIPVYHREK
jgi:hypothetical protein